MKDDEADDDKSVTPESRKDDHTTPTKTKGTKGNKPHAESKQDKRQTSAKSRQGSRSTMNTASPPPGGHGAQTPAAETEGSGVEAAAHDPSKMPR